MAKRSPDERILRRTALRLGLQTVAGVAITVLVLATTGFLVMQNSQRRAQNDLIDSVIAHVDDVSDPPGGLWLVIDHDGTRAVSPGLPPGLPDEQQLRLTAADHATRTVDLKVGHREYRVDTAPYKAGGVVQAALDLGADQAQRSRLMNAFLVTGAFGLLLASGIGAWLAKRAVMPMAAALALQRRFVADAGHELRTPLTLLSTRAQLIRRSLGKDLGHETEPDTLRSDVDGLVRDARLLTDILEDLLLAADPREQPASERIELAGLLREAAETARPAATERGVSITFAADAEPPLVSGSTASLRRAMTALLDNAVRHARGEVRLTIGVRGSQAVIDVADDGPGIDPEILPTLFARFATTPADGARGGSRRYGLGLALVSEIAARHSGSITVADTGDEGATFRLVLPVRGRQRREHTP